MSANIFYPIALVCNNGKPEKIRGIFLQVGSACWVYDDFSREGHLDTRDYYLSELDGLRNRGTHFMAQYEVTLGIDTPEGFMSSRDTQIPRHSKLKTFTKLPLVDEDGTVLSDVSHVLLQSFVAGKWSPLMSEKENVYVVLRPDGSYKCYEKIELFSADFYSEVELLPKAVEIELPVPKSAIQYARTAIYTDMTFSSALNAQEVYNLSLDDDFYILPSYPLLQKVNLHSGTASSTTVVLPDGIAVSDVHMLGTRTNTLNLVGKIDMDIFCSLGCGLSESLALESQRSLAVSTTDMDFSGDVSLKSRNVNAHLANTYSVKGIALEGDLITLQTVRSSMGPISVNCLSDDDDSTQFNYDIFLEGYNTLREGWLTFGNKPPRTANIKITAKESRICRVSLPNGTLCYTLSGDVAELTSEAENIRLNLGKSCCISNVSVKCSQLNISIAASIMTGQANGSVKRDAAVWDFSKSTCDVGIIQRSAGFVVGDSPSAILLPKAKNLVVHLAAIASMGNSEWYLPKSLETIQITAGTATGKAVWDMVSRLNTSRLKLKGSPQVCTLFQQALKAFLEEFQESN